ncbi:chemotaxis protein CheW [Elstera litoralis]|uniref:Chemotaxis protein CheW n=1 Tax=Elstera litoralis TaxID=552518 RepID=A0A0F3IY29_9PROT|nr:chemotaxis protein CheW [Elstera litoralis]KJV10514.1 chemotaxis protein CheW [Elstera litoralis]
MSELVASGKRNVARQGFTADEQRQYVSITIDGQMFGIPVLIVHDVLGPQRITRIPLAPAEVAGSLNLRGRIVTAIDVRLRLGLLKRPVNMDGMSVVVEHSGEFYSLMVDGVGEVLTLSSAEFERNPATLDPRWRDISLGIYRLQDQLLVILDVNRLLDFTRNEAA